MNETLVQRVQAYLAPPGCRVPLAAVSIAFLNGHAIESEIMAAAAERSYASTTVDSRFSIQSITKSFTAAVILRFVAVGKLLLDIPLSEWRPDVPNASRMTIRQCLQHTSGLPDYGTLPAYHEAVRQEATPWTFAEFLHRTHAEQLLFEPGHGWRYSNIGHMILRRLIETVCGQSFEIVAKEVCQPLGLRHTSVIKNREDSQALTPAYSFCVSSDGLPVDIRTRYDPGWVATGVVASTASDIVRFYHRLFAGDLLPGRLLDEMRTVVRASPTPSNQRFVAPSYGLGLIADLMSPYGVLYGHSGGGPGYTSAALHVVPHRDQPVTVAVLSNTENFFEVELMAITILHTLTQ